ncbi:MAG: hypothetical protein ACI9Y8_001322 [Candidatus Omnitrophota bacterium]|jgi:hypothetical protein
MRTRSSNHIYVLVLISALTSGCATIVNSPNQDVPISSYPRGARVIVDGGESYITPTILKLKRKQDHSLLFKKSGYDDLVFKITRSLSGAVAGNILVGGLIGLGVDAISGAGYKLVPKEVMVTLLPKSNPSKAGIPAVARTSSTGPAGVQNYPSQEKIVTPASQITAADAAPSTATIQPRQQIKIIQPPQIKYHDDDFYDANKIIDLYKFRRITMAEYNKAMVMIDAQKRRDAHTYINNLMKYR